MTKPWGAWWPTAYAMRNDAVHEGSRIDLPGAVRAKEATAVLIRELRADLVSDDRLADLAGGLKVDFADAEHDYRWGDRAGHALEHSTGRNGLAVDRTSDG
jgi:hypothetical protein